tara:strand:+ start:207 stop:572 length:366 start_codon:yes stop_codon:yes gene_type:complete
MKGIELYSPSKNIVQMLPNYFKKSHSDMKELLGTGDMPLIEFKDGWIEFEIKDGTAFIYTSFFKNNKLSKEVWDAFISETKKQGCNKIEMITHRNPEVWKKAYKFKHTQSIMTLDLKGVKK